MLTVVFVHGFWHGSWCWSPVTEQLTRRGVRSVAVDLDGHGLKSQFPLSRWARPFEAAAFATEPSAVGAVTATSAAETLIRQLAVIGRGEPCVVAAHSMGGTVATAAAELAPELFAHLVYVTAFAPVSGQPAGMYIGLPECAASMVPALHPADPAVIGALRIDTGARNLHAAIRETFAVTPARYGAIPHTYVTCARDNAIPLELQRRFIKEIDAVSGTPTAVIELDSSHSPFLSQPAALATVIAELAPIAVPDGRVQGSR